MEPTAERECSSCHLTKPFSEFYKNAKGKYGVSQKCKECSKSNNNSYLLKKKYGITQDEYNALLAAQDGKCAMCGNTCKTGYRLAVDHDHNDGSIRGLLCMRCNKFVVGSHTLAEARKIVSYLEKPPADVVFGSTRYVPVGMEKPKKKRRKRATTRYRRKNLG